MRVLLTTLTFLFSIGTKAQDFSCVSLFQQSQEELSDEVTEGLYKLAEDQVRTQKLPMSESKNMILREIKRQVFEKANEFDSPEVVFSFYRNVIADLSQVNKESAEAIRARNSEIRLKIETMKHQKKLVELRTKFNEESLEVIFFLAIKKRDSESIKLLLEENISIEDRNSALRIVADKGYVEIVRLLLEAGADKDASREDGRTALHVAAQRGREKVARLLIEAGANIEARAEEMRTALHWSAINGHTDIVKLLIEAGANIEAQDSYGTTALKFAKRNENYDIVQFLQEEIQRQRKHSPGLINQIKNWWSR